ncbi:MAG: hypothetical protein M1823_001388 [Watsoniomyces obsoletus]|nr:MAG: hypothetical protein M1823_001388 [Watsoniomyces obsoletus]
MSIHGHRDEEPDDQLYQKACYIFEPKSKRPAKRQKVHHDYSTPGPKPVFVPLLNGHETAEQVDLRYKTYQKLWSEQEETINGRKLLDYDLEILHGHVRRLELEKVVVAFQDGEAFDGILLSELISLMSSWLDRIPFVLLFGVATSVGHFQAKLSRFALKRMRGDQFDVEKVDTVLPQVLREIFQAPKSLKLGPGLASAMFDRHRDHVQSIQSFATGVKYAYMSHFFANPLSVLLAEEEEVASMDFPSEFYEAVRNLGSFRRLVQNAMEVEEIETAVSLLKDDEFLKFEISMGLTRCEDATYRLRDAVNVLHAISANLSKRESIPFTVLYQKAVSGQLEDSAIVRDLLLSMTKMQLKDISSMLEELASLELCSFSLPNKLLEIREQIESELSKNIPGSQAQEQTPRLTMRTRNLSRRVTSTETPAATPGQGSSSVQLIRSVQETLETYFEENLIHPKYLFLHEVYFFDFKSPYREVFSPKARFAIERALLHPRDYLACDCCEPSLGGLSATQPATAILYQLYLESGALINVFDLWSAFYAIIGGEDGEDCDSVNALALFYRALADLKYMGMIKHSRKRTDHISKLAWKGL